MLTPGVTEQVGMAMRFSVVVDGLDLGRWRECKGLAVALKGKVIQEGGNNQNEVFLPEVVSYPEITLTRAMNKQDSTKLQGWLGSKFRSADPGNLSAEGMLAAAMSLIPSIVTQFVFAGDPAAITLYDAHGVEVYTWTLQNCFPTKWEGPALDGNAKGVAEEKLTLRHEGFLGSGLSAGAVAGAVAGAAGAVAGAVAGSASASISF